jgi:hypothetical protein
MDLFIEHWRFHADGIAAIDLFVVPTAPPSGFSTGC